MIEINLLPGAQKKRKKRATPGFSLKLPESMPKIDRMMAFIIAAWIIGPALGAWLYFGIQGERSDLQVQLDQAVADSTRYAGLIQTHAQIRARQDTIAQKLTIIQEIDAARYIWPHILDEVSITLPQFTWLTSLYETQGGAAPSFQIEGLTGSLPALTRYMDALEASPFLRDIQLVSSQQVAVSSGGGSQIANSFVLTGSFEPPSPDAIETVPLFEEDVDGNVTARSEESNGSGPS